MTSERLTRHIATACGASSGIIAALGIIGYASGRRLLPLIPAGAPPVPLWVQIGVLLLAAGLVLLVSRPRSLRLQRGVGVVSALVLLTTIVALLARGRGFAAPAALTYLEAARPLGVMALAAAAAGLAVLGFGLPRSAAGGIALGLATVGFIFCLGFLYTGRVFVHEPWLLATISASVEVFLMGAGIVAAAGPTAWPLRPLVGPTVRAILLRWLLPFVVLAIVLTDVATVNLFSGFSQAIGSVTNTVASVAAAVLVCLYLSRVIGGRLDRAEGDAKRLARLNRVLSRTNTLITRATDADLLFQEACRVAKEEGAFTAWIGKGDPGTRMVVPVAWHGEADGYVANIRIPMDDVPEGVGSTATALREGKTSVIRDVATDPRAAPWRERMLARGIRSTAAFPLRTLGSVTHVYSVYANEVGWFNEEQVRLLEAMAEDFSYALGALEKERQRTAAEREVTASESRFRALIENSSDLITIADETGAIQYQSPSIKALLGYDAGERQGGTILDLIHPEDVPLVRAAIDRALSADPSRPPITCRLRHKNGTWRVLESVGWNRLTVGEVSGVVIHSRDVTDRSALEEQLRQAQKMEAVGQLASGIAHDFNNVLSIIIANADLVATSLPVDAGETQDDIRDARDAALRGKTMVKELMGLSRAAELEVRPRDLGEITEGVGRMLKHVLPATITVRVTVEADLPAALVDQGAVEQMLLNLATNARDAMPHGGQLTFQVTHAAPDADGTSMSGYLSVAATDTGTGMDEATVRRIFEPFFTTKARGAGTGLGMAMVHGLMVQHAGHVRVASAPGRGTTIHLLFPVAHQPAEAAREVRKLDPRAQRGSETVLVVDDEPALRRVAKRVLERFGYTVFTAEDGAAALQVLKEQRGKIDLVFTDLVMPTMGGGALYREATRAVSTIKFLVATGSRSDDARERRGIPADVPIVRKPWTLDEMVEGVRKALDAR